MFDYLLTYFVPIMVISIFSSTIYFIFEKNTIIKNYKQLSSKQIKNISGVIIDNNGLLRQKIQWCCFEILINENSIFIFPRSFHFIQIRKINLIFSNSDKRFTKSPQQLREIIINRNSVDLKYYPRHLLSGGRTIRLQQLSSEEIKIFEEIKIQKNY